MKKLLGMGLLLMSLVACNSSGDSVNQTPNTSLGTVKTFVPESSKSASVETSKSISKSTLADEFATATTSFETTAGSGNDAYVKIDGYGNVTELGIKSSTFVVVNKFNIPSNNVPVLAQADGGLKYFDSLKKYYSDDTPNYTERTTRTSSTTTEYADDRYVTYDNQGMITGISGYSSANLEMFDGVEISNVADYTTSETGLKRNLGDLVFTYTLEDSKIKTVTIEDNNGTSSDTNDDTTYLVTYTYNDKGYSEVTKEDGVTTSTVDTVYTTTTLSSGDVVASGFDMVYKYYYSNGALAKTDTFHVAYTRDTEGNIAQADVKFKIGGELLNGKFIPKA